MSGPTPVKPTAPNGRKVSRPVWLGEDSRGWDHVRIHVSVLFHPKLSASALVVYAVIAWAAEARTGKAQLGPGVKEIARLTKLSDKTVRVSIDALEKAGLLAVEFRRGRQSVYTLLPPPPLPGAVISTAPPRSELPHPSVEITGVEGKITAPPKEVSFVSDSFPDLKLPSGGTSSPAGSSSPLTALYVFTCKAKGYEPSRSMRGTMGKQLKQLLEEKPEDILREAVRIIADEQKSPANLPLVVMDLEAAVNGASR